MSGPCTVLLSCSFHTVLFKFGSPFVLKWQFAIYPTSAELLSLCSVVYSIVAYECIVHFF